MFPHLVGSGFTFWWALQTSRGTWVHLGPSRLLRGAWLMAGLAPPHPLPRPYRLSSLPGRENIPFIPGSLGQNRSQQPSGQGRRCDWGTRVSGARRGGPA